MEYGSGWLPPMIMRQPEPVRDLFETLLYCTEISEPDVAEPGLADRLIKSDLEAIREQIKELEAQEKTLASKIILAIGTDTGITIAGKKAATYKAQTSKRFDATGFKAADPEAYAAHCKLSTFRVLRVA